jgi:hypothetical protein
MAAPSNKAHIIGPGEYRLNILVAAENARPIEETMLIRLPPKDTTFGRLSAWR